MTQRCMGSITRARPRKKRAAPTPPARAVTFTSRNIDTTYPNPQLFFSPEGRRMLMRRLQFFALERMNVTELRGGRKLPIGTEAFVRVLDQIERTQFLILSG